MSSDRRERSSGAALILVWRRLERLSRICEENMRKLVQSDVAVARSSVTGDMTMFRLIKHGCDTHEHLGDRPAEQKAHERERASAPLPYVSYVLLVRTMYRLDLL